MKAPDSVQTARLVLKRPSERDADSIFSRYASDPDVTKFVAWPTHRSVEHTRAFLAFSATLLGLALRPVKTEGRHDRVERHEHYKQDRDLAELTARSGVLICERETVSPTHGHRQSMSESHRLARVSLDIRPSLD